MTANSERHSKFFARARKYSLLKTDVTSSVSCELARVSCLSPLARQNFPAPLK